MLRTFGGTEREPPALSAFCRVVVCGVATSSAAVAPVCESRRGIDRDRYIEIKAMLAARRAVLPSGGESGS